MAEQKQHAKWAYLEAGVVSEISNKKNSICKGTMGATNWSNLFPYEKKKNLGGIQAKIEGAAYLAELSSAPSTSLKLGANWKLHDINT